MYAEASYGERGDETIMEFTSNKPRDKNGLEFFYHMKGQDTGRLTVCISWS